MGMSRKQITFDLSQDALKQHYPRKETGRDPMSSLQRVKAAGFTLEDSVSLEAVQEAVDRGEGEGLLLPVDA